MNTKNFKIADLIVSRHNVRANITPQPETIAALADNIIAINPDGRLIHPLTVQEVNGVGEVVAGKTRMLALQYLIEDGRLPADATTECNVVETDAEAVMVSQSENLQREQMHPVAEFAGFQKMIEAGHSIERIALAFGVTNRYVEGRLRLANLAPALLDSFQKRNKPNLEQVMALALTDDHARQLAVWEARGGDRWGNSPKQLREALVGRDHIDASTDRRAQLVTVAEYEAAGGIVQASLLSDHTYLLDVELFEGLVREKLNERAALVQAEGWSWVEVYENDASGALTKFGTTRPELRTPTDEEEAQLEALQQAYEDAAQAYEDADHGTDEEEAAGSAMEEAEQALEVYKATFQSFSGEQMSFAGAAVFIDHNGFVEVRRGLVRREDRHALDEAARAGRLATGVAGGRTTGDAGRPAEALSATLKDDLRGLRIIAVQNTLAKNARVAKVLLALWAVGELRTTYDYDRLPLDLGVNGHGNLRSRLSSLSPAVKEAYDAQNEAFEAIVGDLPEDKAECWEVLAAMSDEQLDTLIAYAVATAVNAADAHEGVTGRLLDALDFDMADHFTATEDTYTGRVSKPFVVEALAEVGKAEDSAALLAMKKGPLAELAAQRLAGTGWVPELIRTPGRAPKAADAEPQAPAKAKTAKKASAKKTTTKKPAKK